MWRTSVRRALTCVVTGGVALTLGACSLPGSRPDPEAAADRLATALASGSLEGAPLAGDAEAAVRAHERIVRGLGSPEVVPEVVVGEVDEDGDSATAGLTWSWEVAGETWTYATEAALSWGRAAEGEDEAWRVRWDPSLVEPSLETGERLRRSALQPRRGAVLGAGGEPIVADRPVVRMGIDKAAVPAGSAVRAAGQLAALVGVDRDGFVTQVRQAGARAFVQAIAYRRDEVPPRVATGIESIEGARAVADELPLAPTRDFASGLLGSVGPATAEIVEESEGRVRAGDEVGVSGLQKRYDERLFGQRGAVVEAVGTEGGTRTLVEVEPEPGKPLRTTLDLEIQTAAQRALADIGPASALVAIRPSTGDLVAVASGPGSEGYNTATYGRYAPGSTFKVVSALALLRAGLDPGAEVSCPRTTLVDGKTFKNYDDYPASGLGRITFEEALANSCNTAFITARDRLEAQSLPRAAAALGLGVDHDLGFPAYFGEVGTAGSQTQGAANMIGQGAVLASPMAMAAVVASVVEGEAVLPRLVPAATARQKEPADPLAAREAAALRSMMRAVVQRGSGRLLADLPGEVVAKTGTAEFGEKPPLPTHAWMVAGRDDLAVAVFVERGESGSGTAGPVLRRFLSEVPPG